MTSQSLALSRYVLRHCREKFEPKERIEDAIKVRLGQIRSAVGYANQYQIVIAARRCGNGALSPGVTHRISNRCSWDRAVNAERRNTARSLARSYRMENVLGR